MNTHIASLEGAGHQAALPARLAVAGTLAVATLIVALHALKPELDPSWRFISEYAIGQHGWIMQLAFLIWSASCFALSIALWSEVASWSGRVGVCVLLIVGFALVVAGLFPQDPVTAKPDEITRAGHIHALASMIGIPGIPIAAMLISTGLSRLDRGLRWSAHATWLSLVLMIGYLIWAVPKAGGFNADVWAGWMNRLVVTTYMVWQLMVALRFVGPGAQPDS